MRQTTQPMRLSRAKGGSKEAVEEVPFTAVDGLSTFLKQKGNTLLVKGYAGAGKTTLALQLLRELAPDGGGVYVSSRVSLQKLQREFPWARLGKKGAAPAGGFTDLRLGSPSTVLEEIVGAITSKRTTNSAVVLDTWDGIAKEMDPNERLKAEKMLIAVADSHMARVIFVSEEPQRTTMDFLVDGIVELTREEKYGRVLREIEVQKLRGTLIEQHKYLYTLKDGRFTLIPPYSPAVPSGARRPEPIQDSGPFASFGSAALDAAVGGLRKGGTFVVVYDERVPYDAIRLISIRAVINALNTGKGVFGIPLPGATNSELAEAVRPYVDPEVYARCLALGSLGGEAEAGPPLYSINDADPRQASARITDIVAKLRARSRARSVLIVESVGTLEALFASRIDAVVEGAGKRAGAVRSSGVDAYLLLIQHDSPIASRILAMSNRYLRLITMDRSVVILGEKPASPAYSIDHAPDDPINPRLTLIV